MITYHPESTVIKKVSWDSQTEILCVLFHSKSVWFYFDVEGEVFYELTQAHSTGAFFNKNIRNVYSSYKFTSLNEMEQFLGQEETEEKETV